jgi:hypothetical protein
VNPRVGPALFPVVQIRLGLFQSFEALSFQRRPLGMADSGFDLPFRSGSPTRQASATAP